jgi:hypothetical protein
MVARNVHKPATPTVVPTRWYTLEESAEVARRSVLAMRQLRVKGRGPRFVKVDGRLVVSDVELARWLSGADTAATA